MDRRLRLRHFSFNSITYFNNNNNNNNNSSTVHIYMSYKVITSDFEIYLVYAADNYNNTSFDNVRLTKLCQDAKGQFYCQAILK